MKSISVLLLTIMLFISLNTGVIAQISEGGTPYSFGEEFTEMLENSKIAPISEINIDASATKQYIKENYEELKNYISIVVDINEINVENNGVWYDLENGDRLWMVKIHMEDAASIKPFFNSFSIPKGGRLFIYDEDEKHIIGAFTEKNNRKKNDQFTTALIKSESIIIEYYEPQYVKGQIALCIDRIGYGIKKR